MAKSRSNFYPPFYAGVMAPGFSAGAFWTALNAKNGSLAFAVPVYVGWAVGLYVDQLLSAERKKTAALEFQIHLREFHQEVERQRNADRT